MNSYGLLLTLAVLAFAGSAEASGYDFGDFMATAIGIGISVVGILACLGNYARNKARNDYI